MGGLSVASGWYTQFFVVVVVVVVVLIFPVLDRSLGSAWLEASRTLGLCVFLLGQTEI